jgi:hypothetical protein
VVSTLLCPTLMCLPSCRGLHSWTLK